MLLVYTTCKDKGEAKTIAQSLLEQQLIACANSWQIESLHTWQGKLEESQEYALLLKTKSQLYEKVATVIKQHHSYDTPALFAWQASDIDPEYLAWVDEMTE